MLSGTHARKIEVQPAPASSILENRLEAAGHDPVVRRKPVQQHGRVLGSTRCGTVLDVVDIDTRNVHEGHQRMMSRHCLTT
jgi:hypothetical protein